MRCLSFLDIAEFAAADVRLAGAGFAGGHCCAFVLLIEVATPSCHVWENLKLSWSDVTDEASRRGSR